MLEILIFPRRSLNYQKLVQAERKTAQAERKMKLASIFPRRSRFYPKSKIKLVPQRHRVRCMLRWLFCPGLRPGLTESVSALRTSPRSPGGRQRVTPLRSSASPKRMSRVAVSDPMRHRCAPTNGGYYGVSRLRCDVNGAAEGISLSLGVSATQDVENR